MLIAWLVQRSISRQNHLGYLFRKIGDAAQKLCEVLGINRLDLLPNAVWGLDVLQ